MRRSYLKLGDKSTANGVVTEGIDSSFHEGALLTFVGAKVSCPSCHSTGTIIAAGPRWPGTMMGKLPALEGDLCACKCDERPKMLASQDNMTMSFDSHALASMGFGANGLPADPAASTEHWIKFKLSEPGSCEGLRCAAHFADGSVEHGIFDADNTVRFDRSSDSSCQKVELLTDNQVVSGSVLEDLLNAMGV